MTDTNQLEALQKQIAELQQENARLAQQIRDDEVELQATVDEFYRTQEELELAKQAAERSDKVKSAFLASMSHELRTPLNSIINFTKFVANELMGPINEEQKKMLTDVIDSGKHLLSLINDVLDMSKIEAGSLKLFVEDNVDLNAILASVVTTTKSLLAEKNIDLQTEFEPDLPLLRGDRQRILQILLNIASNACKFTEQGVIKIKASRQGEDILLAIQDTGPGIAPEDQTLVFEAFKQTTTGIRQGSGTGLGMPISKNLTEAHGGRLWLESQSGNGTTFFVSLPIKSTLLQPIMFTEKTT